MKVHLWWIAPGGDYFMDGAVACGRVNNSPCDEDPELVTCRSCQHTELFADALARRRTCLSSWPVWEGAFDALPDMQGNGEPGGSPGAET